jgi:hypothetical protein
MQQDAQSIEEKPHMLHRMSHTNAYVNLNRAFCLVAIAEIVWQAIAAEYGAGDAA